MNNTIHQSIHIALSLCIAALVTFHSHIWPCDIGPTANATTTATVSLYDSTASRTTATTAQRPRSTVRRAQPISWKTRSRQAQPTDDVPIPYRFTTSDWHVRGDSAGWALTDGDITLSGPWSQLPALDALMNVAAYYDTTFIDTTAQVRITARDSVYQNRITWRQWSVSNQRPTATATVVEHTPDRAQVYAGIRLGMSRPAGGTFVPMAGAGLRVKMADNYMWGASYLHGLDNSQAITADLDILIRFNGVRERRAAKRAQKLAETLK